MLCRQPLTDLWTAIRRSGTQTAVWLLHHMESLSCDRYSCNIYQVNEIAYKVLSFYKPIRRYAYPKRDASGMAVKQAPYAA